MGGWLRPHPPDRATAPTEEEDGSANAYCSPDLALLMEAASRCRQLSAQDLPLRAVSRAANHEGDHVLSG